MKYMLFIFLILLISCKKIEIKSSESANIDVKNAYIRTKNIDYNEEKEINMTPTINIISPKDGSILNETFSLKVNVTNFKLVPPNWYPQQGQGHIQVWFDDMEFRSSKTEFEFESEGEGEHTIKAELMLSNHTALPYSHTIKIIINKS